MLLKKVISSEFITSFTNSTIRYLSLTMRYFFTTFIVSICCLLFQLNSFGQKLCYDIYLNNDDIIGEVHVNQVQNGNTQNFEIFSAVNFKVLWKQYQRETHNSIYYQDGTLFKSFNSVFMNGELEDSSAIIKNNLYYKGFKTPNEHFDIKEKDLTFSMVKLYYHEPVGLTKVYSERYLDHCKIEIVEDHKYKIHLPGGKHNYYTYKDGVLTEAFIDRAWFNLVFKPKKNCLSDIVTHH